MDYDAADRVAASERAKAERRATLEARREMINIEIVKLQRRLSSLEVESQSLAADLNTRELRR
jgi:hypothetical protein